MTTGADVQRPLGWLESYNFVQIFRTFRLAVQPAKLVLAFAAVVLTMAWGGLLDQFWRWADRGVADTAISVYVEPDLLGTEYEEPTGDRGVFAVWSEHTARSVLSVRQLGGVCQATAWLVTRHPWYALLFYVGALVIWSLLGGAVCRIAAVQFARDEKIGWREAMAFVWQRFFSGFFLAPLLPLLMILIVAVFLVLGGAFLRIPWFGDVVGGLLFFLAILGGAAIALIVIGWAVGGWLFWPTIAAEGSEALDAVSRSFNYIGATPWKTVLYALVAGVYGYLCFWFVRLLAYLILAATHVFVGFGTAPFGWWLREDGMSKLGALWASPTPTAFHTAGAPLSGIEIVSGVLVGMWVLLVGGLLWAYLASYCLSASTVIYFLLRQANDAMDLDDVYIETYEETEYKPEAPPAAPVESEPGAEVAVEDRPAAAAAPESPPAEAKESAGLSAEAKDGGGPPAEPPAGGDDSDDKAGEGESSDPSKPPADV